jgi:GTP-binding protein
MNIPNHPLYGRAEFICGALCSSQYPPDRGAEVIFLGRSNAGKSSAINTVTGIDGLARTSKTPGRTQQINFFLLEGERRLVDPPGYGYAAVPAAVKNRWMAAVEAYLNQRRSLRGVYQCN